MTRLEEALRRAGKSPNRTDTFNVPSARALDWFPTDGTAPAPVETTEPERDAAADAPLAAAPEVIPTPADAVDVMPLQAAEAPRGGRKAIGAADAREKLVV